MHMHIVIGVWDGGEESLAFGQKIVSTPDRGRQSPVGSASAFFQSSFLSTPPSVASSSHTQLFAASQACQTGSHLRAFALAVCFAQTTLVPDIYMVHSPSSFRPQLWPSLTILSRGPSPNSPHFVSSIAIFTI